MQFKCKIVLNSMAQPEKLWRTRPHACQTPPRAKKYNRLQIGQLQELRNTDTYLCRQFIIFFLYEEAPTRETDIISKYNVEIQWSISQHQRYSHHFDESVEPYDPDDLVPEKLLEYEKSALFKI